MMEPLIRRKTDMLENPAPDWIIKTKLAPPKLSGSLLQRQRLLDRFQESTPYTLSLIHAPAGYGKTILLKQWYDLAITNNMAAAWLSLEEDDNQPEIFAYYLAAALAKAGIPSPLLNTLTNRTPETQKIKSLAAGFINRIAACPKNVVIFLDDYHKISDANTNALLKAMVVHAPDNLRIIIASRKTLAFSTAGFKANHYFEEVTSADLKLTLSEFSLLLTTEISDKNLLYVWDRIEGWPIAAKIVNHTITQGLISAENITHFSGRTSDLGDYISDEIFTSLNKREKDFLLITCLPSRFNAELADHLCGQTGSYRIIEKLKEMDLFLVALDSEGDWYRYHQLFQQYLLNKLDSDRSQEVAALRVASAHWFFQNNHPQEAIEQALLSKDLKLAAEIIDSIGLWRLTIQGKISLATTYLNKLPIEVVEQYPSLIVMHIFMHTKAGDLAYAKNKLDGFLEKSNNITEWRGKTITQPLQDSLRIIVNCLIDPYLDKPLDAAALESLYRLLSEISPDQPIFSYTLHECLGYHHTDMAEFTSALNHHQKSLAGAVKLNSDYALIYIYFHYAEIYLHTLELEKVEQALQQAQAIIEKNYNSDPNLNHALAVFRAKFHYLHFDLNTAATALKQASGENTINDSWLTLYFSFFEVKCGIEAFNRHHQKVGTLLEQANAIAREHLLTRLTQFTKLTEIKLALLAEMPDNDRLLSFCASLAEIEAQLKAYPLSRFLPSRLRLTKARLLLHLNRIEEADKLLEMLIRDFRKSRQNLLLVESYLLKSLTEYRKGNEQQAVECCRHATVLCLEGQCKALHMENAALLMPVYQLTLRAGTEPLTTFLKEITATVNIQQRYGLTEREYLTVCELAKGLSNREIAENICVSEDTVKYRLKSIFKKWHLSSREDVAKKAIQLQLDG